MTKQADFDGISNQLWDTELRELRDLWTTYNYLYVEDSERAEKLWNPRWGGFFWSRVRGWMVSEIILTISRLTDPPEVGERRNLTLEALLDDPRLPDKLERKLRCVLKTSRKSVEKIRKHRNRVVAHRDERTALGQDPLPGLDVRQIRDVISGLEDVHRKHRGACMGSHVGEYGTHTHGGVESLFRRLEQSERASSIFAHANRSVDGKLRDWDRARRVFFPIGA
ncbi:MAG: hypothetical protein F4107_14205 [Gemmatimonadetes bacterium]|nr:hypothetical protein [Gemmatimonadota bacterium]MYD14315.1 hypothetical protein [Gemmatimonadota bacterium]MYI67070.1 hypothetical protein [Gemmatimonadota bacterium]